MSTRMLEKSDINIESELASLFAQSANPESQSIADEIFKHQSSLQPDGIYREFSVIRASSPNVLTIYPHSDTHLCLYSDQSNVTLQLAPFGQGRGTFAFNMGVTALKLSLHEEHWADISNDTAKEILARLPVKRTVSDHGDLPRWMHMTRTDDEGSILMRIDDDGNSIFSDEQKLSAFFSENAQGQGMRPVEHHIMTGLWTLGLALKIQEQAKASGTVYDLMRQGKMRLTNGNRQGISQMLLDLDQ